MKFGVVTSILWVSNKQKLSYASSIYIYILYIYIIYIYIIYIYIFREIVTGVKIHDSIRNKKYM